MTNKQKDSSRVMYFLDIEIEKGVPIPREKTYWDEQAEPFMDLFKKMKVGDSFFLPMEDRRESYKIVRVAIWNFCDNYKARDFMVKKETVKGKGWGYRVWRTH